MVRNGVAMATPAARSHERIPSILAGWHWLGGVALSDSLETVTIIVGWHCLGQCGGENSLSNHD
jgi:hypothetical protein